MPIWPFKRKVVEQLDAQALRRNVAEAASWSESVLLHFCKTYRKQLLANIELLSKAPEPDSADGLTIEEYFPGLISVAECLSAKCSAPQLWTRLTSNSDNPITRLNQWYADMAKRMEQLEYDDLISEGLGFLDVLKTAGGTGVGMHRAYVNGRIGQLYFQSGQAAASLPYFQQALQICVEQNDVEGRLAHLNNLVEANRYLGLDSARDWLLELIELTEKLNQSTTRLEKRLQLMKAGEPLCRLVGNCENDSFEVDEIEHFEIGHKIAFVFVRNRLSLEKSTILVQQGNELASSGKLSDALDKYREAEQTDPFDPDPCYQSGACLLEIGAFEEARDAFAKVEQLAPGWFRCRSDKWLAELGLEENLSMDAYRTLRILEDGGLGNAMALSIAQQAVERYPDFAPFYLLLGESLRNAKDNSSAIEAYRHGLRVVEEPDLESRLLAALAIALPKDSVEKAELCQRVLKLNGSLMAAAAVRLLQCLSRHSH